MNGFLLGVASSIVASLCLLVLTNREDIRYFLSSRSRYHGLAGGWLQYHLSTDTALASTPIWVEHSDDLKLTPFGRVKGSSASKTNLNYQYRIIGSIRSGVMRLRLENRTAMEEPVTMVFPDLLAQDALIGIWTGQDFDQEWSSGPVILARERLDLAALSRCAERRRNLSISAPVRHFVRYYPGEHASAWYSDVGSRTLETLPEGNFSRMVMAGAAFEDGTGKLVHGPHERLPLIGHYKASFHLAIKNLEHFSSTEELVRLDVFGHDHALTRQYIQGARLANDYSWYHLFFDYTDLTMSLEYRVALLKRGLEGSVWDVTVEKVRDIQLILSSLGSPSAGGGEA